MNLKTRLEERDGQTVFVINRGEWMRGPQPEGLPGLLWDGDERRGCCLGLAALCEGVSMRTLQGVETPGKVIERLPTAYIDAWLRDGGDDKRGGGEGERCGCRRSQPGTPHCWSLLRCARLAGGV